MDMAPEEDNYKADGNRIGSNAAAHDVTVGASFGAERELRFKHLEMLGPLILKPRSSKSPAMPPKSTQKSKLLTFP